MPSNKDAPKRKGFFKRNKKDNLSKDSNVPLITEPKMEEIEKVVEESPKDQAEASKASHDVTPATHAQPQLAKVEQGNIITISEGDTQFVHRDTYKSSNDATEQPQIIGQDDQDKTPALLESNTPQPDSTNGPTQRNAVKGKKGKWGFKKNQKEEDAQDIKTPVKNNKVSKAQANESMPEPTPNFQQPEMDAISYDDSLGKKQTSNTQEESLNTPLTKITENQLVESPIYKKTLKPPVLNQIQERASNRDQPTSALLKNESRYNANAIPTKTYSVVVDKKGRKDLIDSPNKASAEDNSESASYMDNDSRKASGFRVGLAKRQDSTKLSSVQSEEGDLFEAEDQYEINRPVNQEGEMGGLYLGSTDVHGDNGTININGQNINKAPEGPTFDQEFIPKNGETKEERIDEADKRVNEAMIEHDVAQEQIYQEFEQQHQEIPMMEQPQDDKLLHHREDYKAYSRQYKLNQKEDKWSMENLRKQLQEKPIYGTKYNYTLEGEVMNHYSFETKIQISEDGSKLVISNRKPSTWPEYINEMTPDDLRAEQKLRRQQIANGTYVKPEQVNDKAKQNIKHVNPVHNNDQYSWFESSCTCKIDDIEAFNFGGFSSRFWIFRKHMISMEYDAMKMINQKPGGRCNFPFFNWQCITITVAGRTIDLVIKHDEDMSLLLRFLTTATNTMDGRRDSAEWYVKAALHYEIIRQEKRLNRKIQKIRDATEVPDDEEYDDWLTLQRLTEEQKHQIYLDKKKEIHRQTMFKYTLMRVRSKISFSSFQNRMTINELFLSTILRCYRELSSSGSIPKIANYSPEIFSFFNELMNDPNSGETMKNLFILAKDPVVRARKEQIYVKKEFAALGVEKMEDLNFLQQKQLTKLFEKNLSDDIYNRDLHAMAEEKKQKTCEENVKGMSGGFGLFDKSKCRDIFLHTKVEGLSMYDVRSARVMLKFKYDCKVMERKFTKVKFILGIAGLCDQFYIMCALKKITLLKQMFVLDIEHNLECYIPEELSCDTYPKSFQYYDPIVQIINQLFAVKSKLYHCLKTEFFIKKIVARDVKKKFLEDAGFVTIQKTWKQDYKHDIIKMKETPELKLVQSKHSQSLQKSRYIMVESTEQGLEKIAEMKTYFLEKKFTRGPKERTKNLEDQTLELRFCKDAEVNMKRQKFIIFKQSQFMKHDHLKNNGQKFHTIQLIQRFVTNELDYLYKNRPRDLKYGPAKELECDRNLDLIPIEQMTGRQKTKLHNDRLRYAEYLMDISEQKVMARRAHIRQRQLKETYEECGPNVKFQVKNDYVETRLEQRFAYFKNMNDMNNTGAETEQIRKDLFKLNNAIKNAKKSKRVDPYQVLSNMSGDSKTFGMPLTVTENRSDITSDF